VQITMIIKHSRRNAVIMIATDDRQNCSSPLERKDSAEMSVNNDCNEKKEIHNRKKDVSFDPEVIMTEVIHHKNYTMEEKIRCWYNQEDFAQIKKEFKQTLELMKKAGGIPKEQRQEYSFRGLENRMYERALARKINRKEARRAVFEEQEIHRQHLENEEEKQLMRNDAEEETIAARYSLYSKRCALKAYSMGLMDEAEAFDEDNPKQERLLKKYYNETKTRRKKSQQQKQQQQQWVSIFHSTIRRHCESFRSHLSRAA